MSGPAWLDRIRPGDLVVVAGGVGEPTTLLTDLLAGAPAGVEVFVGLSHSEALRCAGAARLLSFGGLGPLGRTPLRDTVEVLPVSFDDVPRALRDRGRPLVVLLQVGPADEYGRHGLGASVDYTHELLGDARLVVAEVNPELPATSAPRVPASALTLTVTAPRPLPVVAVPEVGAVHERIAALVAGLVPGGATLQIGLGAVAAALGPALRGHRDLSVRSTLVGDWLLDLLDGGAVRPGAVTISEAAGSAALYRRLGEDGIEILPVPTLLAPIVREEIDRLVAVNSALQVDLTGQVNAESVRSGHVGAVGGQAEFLRAAHRSTGGLAVIALPAETTSGRSRIVATPDPAVVTTARSVVDVVVTEHGVADLRGLGLRERRAALLAVAAPHHRAELEEATSR